MSVMLAESKVWAEEPGVEMLATPHAGTVEISILVDGQPVATATIARWRWDRVVQAVLPVPTDLQ
jgi:hypothetical protein